MPLRSRDLIPLLLFLPLSVGADAVSWTSVDRAIVEQHAIPGYEALAESTRALAAETEALCAGPDADSLTRARDAFHKAMDAWQGIAHLTLGPADAFMRRYHLAYWPDKHGTGARQMRALLAAEDPAVLAPGALARNSAAVQGLPALERLLFDQAPGPETFGTGGSPTYRCLLAAAVAANVARISGDILAGWSEGPPPFRELVLTAGEGNAAFASAEEVAVLVLRDLRNALQVAAELKLAAPLGGDAAAAQPKRAESWRSQRSLRNLERNLVAARELYLAGFAPVLADRPGGEALDARLRTALDEAVAAAKLDAPLETLIADPEGRPRIEALQARVERLQGLVAGELAEALGLSVGFNALDGD